MYHFCCNSNCKCNSFGVGPWLANVGECCGYRNPLEVCSVKMALVCQTASFVEGSVTASGGCSLIPMNLSLYFLALQRLGRQVPSYCVTPWQESTGIPVNSSKLTFPINTACFVKTGGRLLT